MFLVDLGKGKNGRSYTRWEEVAAVVDANDPLLHEYDIDADAKSIVLLKNGVLVPAYYSAKTVVERLELAQRQTDRIPSRASIRANGGNRHGWKVAQKARHQSRGAGHPIPLTVV